MLSARLTALLKRVSRSFYLSVRILPGPVQAQVGLGYLLARAADTIADTALLPPSSRVTLLEALRAAVHGDEMARNDVPDLIRAELSAAGTTTGPGTAAAAAQAEQELLGELGECLTLLGPRAQDGAALPPGPPGLFSASDRALIERVLDQLITGMVRDLVRFPIADGRVAPSRVVALATRDELDEYTYFAAGCVGEFWTDLMAAHRSTVAHLGEPELRERGVKLGKALQMVNVVRDVAADLRNGRCYWPLELLAPHGLTPERLASLAAPRAEPPTLAEADALRAVSAELLQKTRALCIASWPYVREIPVSEVRLRLACTWPLLLALDTVAALQAVGSPLFCPATPVKVDRARVYELTARSSAAALRDAAKAGRTQETALDRVFSQILDQR